MAGPDAGTALVDYPAYPVYRQPPALLPYLSYLTIGSQAA
jgi:hypothetical protein